MTDERGPVRIPPVKIEFSPADRAEIARRIDRCLATGQVAQGENVQEFEQEFARYAGVRHAVAVNSGGAAIEVAMRLLGVQGRDVLVPVNTFAASAGGVLLAGGRVRFVDVDRRTFGASLEGLQAAVTPETAGVMLVHIGGIITPEIEAIRDWCRARGLWLFEDAAHAHGSRHRGTAAGAFGIAGAYSFFATKVMTSGEGGMLVTDDDGLADRARGLRDYGKPDPWVSFHTQLGSNWRMPEFCAAVGVVHLRRLDEFVAWRDKIARVYAELLHAVADVEPVLPAGQSSWYKFIVLLPGWADRDRVKMAMKRRGVSLSGGVYEVPLHRQPVFQAATWAFPVADDVCARHVCLPLYFGMTDDEAATVVRARVETLADKEIRK
jgi:dTDP-4-amino-4,6-dideoxygalactose transaminase